MLDVIVVGGGISAGALAQLHKTEDIQSLINLTLYEREENLNSRNQGYVLGIENPSIEIFNTMRPNSFLNSIINDKRNIGSGFRLFGSSLKELAYVPIKFGMFVERLLLKKALLNDINIEWSHKFVEYRFDNSNGKVIAIFQIKEGSKTILKEVKGDLLIGADGANSLVRSQYEPSIIYEDLHITNIAGCTNLNLVPKFIMELATSGGSNLSRFHSDEGISFMCLPNNNENQDADELLWVLSYPGKIDEWKDKISENENEDIFDEYHDSSKSITSPKILSYAIDKIKDVFESDVVDVIKSTNRLRPLFGPRQIYSTDENEVKKLLSNHERRIILMGDAAHASTSHRGLGANVAILDAKDLISTLLSIARDKELIEAKERDLIKVQSINLSSLLVSINLNVEKYNKIMVRRGIWKVVSSKQSTNMIHSQSFGSRMTRRFIFPTIGFISNLINKRGTQIKTSVVLITFISCYFVFLRKK